MTHEQLAQESIARGVPLTASSSGKSPNRPQMIMWIKEWVGLLTAHGEQEDDWYMDDARARNQ